MLIVTIKTDKPEAELGLYDATQQLAYHPWQAHRQLAETIHAEIKQLLTDQAKELADIQGIVAYKGPGSFTGLRIGLTVANTLADGLDIPIVSETSEDWQKHGIERLMDGQNEQQVVPEYGALPHITAPKK
jgi:tRNA threonylcarbamoyladenosine biosynthesis protein TsaB